MNTDEMAVQLASCNACNRNLGFQECSRLQQESGQLEEEHRGHVAEVVADVEAMKKAMADQRDELDKAAQRAKRQHDEEMSVQKARLASLTGTDTHAAD